MSYIHRLDRILRNPGNVIEGRETAYAIAFLADAVSDLNETLRRGDDTEARRGQTGNRGWEGGSHPDGHGRRSLQEKPQLDKCSTG